MNFSESKIHNNIKKQLSDCFESGRIPHAVIVEGSQESDRREFANYFAQALLCSSEEKPCGVCPGCIKVKAGFHSDLAVFEGNGKNSAVNIDDVRTIRSSAYVVPNEAQYKVYIVCNAHRMNEYAQNALLKCLEEPPSYVVIILECEDKSLLLETVRSRSTFFRLGESEEKTISEKKLEKARELASNMAKAIVQPSEAELMSLIGSLEKDKESLKLCVKELSLILRDAMVISQTSDSTLCVSEESDGANLLSQHLTADKLMGMINSLAEIDDAADKNANNSLLLSRMCYLLRRNAGR